MCLQFSKVLFLRLQFSKVLGCNANKNPEWDVSPAQKAESSIPFMEVVFPQQFQAPHAPLHQPKLVVHTKKMEKLLHLVDTTEVKRGPQESPGYWVVSGARLVVEKKNNSLVILHQKISLEILAPLLDVDNNEFGDGSGNDDNFGKGRNENGFNGDRQIGIHFEKLKLRMALKLPAVEATNVVIQSIGCGYDISLDLRLSDRSRRYLSDVGRN
ncbi:unnamed protein product [Lactuca saligna]|uniref:Uncharacterized protein n=1 Tax=Lactuca saligna TaxID=75948 RepID=A0AA36EQU4_LACSI|nr:unnamed protein product [Lactuca saligna]